MHSHTFMLPQSTKQICLYRNLSGTAKHWATEKGKEEVVIVVTEEDRKRGVRKEEKEGENKKKKGG